jgi:hypothetical protein
MEEYVLDILVMRELGSTFLKQFELQIRCLSFNDLRLSRFSYYIKERIT